MKLHALLVALLFSAFVVAGSQPMKHEITGLDSLSNKLNARIASPESLQRNAIKRTFEREIGRLTKSLDKYSKKYPNYDFSGYQQVLSEANQLLTRQADAATASASNVASSSTTEKTQPASAARSSKSAKKGKVKGPHKGTTQYWDKDAAKLDSSWEGTEHYVELPSDYSDYFNAYSKLNNKIKKSKKTYPEFDFSKWEASIATAETNISSLQQATGYAGQDFAQYIHIIKDIEQLEVASTEPYSMDKRTVLMKRKTRSINAGFKSFSKKEPDVDLTALLARYDAAFEALDAAIMDEIAARKEALALRDEQKQAYEKASYFARLPFEPVKGEHTDKLLVFSSKTGKPASSVRLDEGFRVRGYLEDSVVNIYRAQAKNNNDTDSYAAVSFSHPTSKFSAPDVAESDMTAQMEALFVKDFEQEKYHPSLDAGFHMGLKIKVDGKVIHDERQMVELNATLGRRSGKLKLRGDNWLQSNIIDLDHWAQYEKDGKTSQGRGIGSLTEALIYGTDEDRVVEFEVTLYQDPSYGGPDAPLLVLKSDPLTIEMDDDDAIEVSRRLIPWSFENAYIEDDSEDLFDDMEDRMDDLRNVYILDRDWTLITHALSGNPLSMERDTLWVRDTQDGHCMAHWGVTRKIYDGNEYQDWHLHHDSNRHKYRFKFRCELMN